MRPSLPRVLLAVLALAFAVAPLAVPRQATAAGDCTTDASLDAEERELLRLVNQHRADNGRAPLQASYYLSRAAQWKSEDLANRRYFAHDDIGRTWWQRILDCGYNYGTGMGENIAAGNSTALATFNQWKNSAGHNANMLDAGYTAIGIGRAFSAGSPYGWYWTNEFGGVNDGWALSTNPSPTTTPSAKQVKRAEKQWAKIPRWMQPIASSVDQPAP